jgi:hypothetical protein
MAGAAERPGDNFVLGGVSYGSRCLRKVVMLACYSGTMVQTLETDGSLCKREADDNVPEGLPQLIAPVSSGRTPFTLARAVAVRTLMLEEQKWPVGAMW